jgi:hypothetical protein
MIPLSAGNGYTFCPQDVADLALGDSHLELIFKELDQLRLSESRVFLLLLP